MTPLIRGLIAELPHAKHGSALFVRAELSVKSASSFLTPNHTEVLSVDIGYCSIIAVYSPPGQIFDFHPSKEFLSNECRIVIGDSNSHSTAWGYNSADDSGEAVEKWAELYDLELIHNPKLPYSFNSGRWKRRYNPDLIFVSSRLCQSIIKSICQPIPRTQHRPINCSIQSIARPIIVPVYGKSG